MHNANSVSALLRSSLITPTALSNQSGSFVLKGPRCWCSVLDILTGHCLLPVRSPLRSCWGSSKSSPSSSPGCEVLAGRCPAVSSPASRCCVSERLGSSRRSRCAAESRSRPRSTQPRLPQSHEDLQNRSAPPCHAAYLQQGCRLSAAPPPYSG